VDLRDARDFPLPGFVPWDVLGEGSGDAVGYYWPVGKECEEPVVCQEWHDTGTVAPISSSIPACLALGMSTERWDTEELEWLASSLDTDLSGVAPLGEAPARSEASDWWGDYSLDQLLDLDPNSPHLLMLAARRALQIGDLGESARLLPRALERLPEYTAALFLLAQVQRRQSDIRGAATAMLEVLTSPQAFLEPGWDAPRAKCLGWLKRMRDDVLPDCPDPLWKARHRLTFITGVKWNDDYLIYEDAVEEYHALGWGTRAVRMRILIGELMSGETVSFRDRYGWSREMQRTKLAADLQRAGLPPRFADA
jgi:tetratricopeptide (TPR) repeat protein